MIEQHLVQVVDEYSASANQSPVHPDGDGMEVVACLHS